MRTSELRALERYPLSAAQRRLWFLARLNPGSCAYHNTHLIRFGGHLEGARLGDALHSVIARHESLRMRFADEPGGDVVAIVVPALRIVVPTLDVSDLPAAEFAGYERRFVDDFARAPFDLAGGPLVRAALLRYSASMHALVIVVHHIVFDRWSFGVLMRELAAFYRAACSGESAALPALRAGYARCSQVEAAEAGRADAHLAYWRALLAGERQRLELPADRARPAVPSDRGAVVATAFEAELVRRVAQVGAARGATPYMTFLAAFFVLLQRSTGQTDLLVGTPVAGRGRLEREPLIGLFVNTLPVRVRTEPTQTFCDLLANVRAATLGMLAHADVPFDRLVHEELAGREGSRNPFFDVIFNFHNTPPVAAWMAGLDVRSEDVDVGTSRLDLAVTLRPEADGTLTCRIEYSSDLFERASIELLVTHFGVLLECIAAQPEAPIAHLALASGAERDLIVNVWSRPDRVPAVPPPGGALSVHALVAFNAAHRPGAIALIEDGGEPMTYAELDARANCLAHALRARGVGRDVRVGLYLERSASAVVAMLAALKAGGAYVPLDPAYPPERIDEMLGSAGVTTIVARRESFAALPQYARHLVAIDDPAHRLLDAQHAPAGSVDPHSLAYVMFTSGSTGRPKPVAIVHRGVSALVTQTPLLACTADDNVLLHAALTFDASVLLWAPLVYGARLVVMPAGPFSLAEFAEQLRKYAISVVDLSSALFNALVDERIDCLRDLRRCVVAGDVLSPVHSARFVREVPGCRLFNGYGPTEITVAASFHEILPDAIVRRSVPIGRPAAAARIYILDAQLRPVAAGVPGEVWIGGSGVAREYLNDPVLTAERFMRDPFAAEPDARLYRSGDRARWLADGHLEFLGRADAQVKIRGFRIEPAEIEFALLDHPSVRHAAVVVRGDANDERHLIAYAEVSDCEVTATALRAFLRTKLPPYAVPSQLVVLESMPKTSSGKLDRLHLPDSAAPPPQALSADPAPNAIERTVGSIVAGLLHAERVGRHDDFFAIGGHSLLATRVLARVADAFGVDISLRSFFRAPSVAQLADLVAAGARSSSGKPPHSPIASEIDALSEAELDALLAAELGQSQSQLKAAD